MVITPIKQIMSPTILFKLIFSLNKNTDRITIKTGEEVYMIPILAIVVDIPAIKGNAPQTPHPIEPRNKSLKDSFFSSFFLLIISVKKKGNKIMKTVNHLQKAKEIGGTNSTPPRAIIVFVDMNTG